MARVRVLIDGKKTVKLGCTDFVSRREAHSHLFKHVIRICCLTKSELSSELDPENWSSIIDSPPLKPGLRARKNTALKTLANCHGCTLGKDGLATDKPCTACKDSSAQASVDNAFKDLLGAYLGIAREAIEWALENPSARQPRLLSFLEPKRHNVRIKAIDNRGIRAVGVLSSSWEDIEMISCYRSKTKSYAAAWRDMCREQAGHRKEGTSISIEIQSKETTS